MAIILLLYFIGVLIFAVVGLVGVFHAVKYKMPGDSALRGAYIFMGTSAVILVISLFFIFRADWSQGTEVFKNNLIEGAINPENK